MTLSDAPGGANGGTGDQSAPPFSLLNITEPFERNSVVGDAGSMTSGKPPGEASGTKVSPPSTLLRTGLPARYTVDRSVGSSTARPSALTWVQCAPESSVLKTPEHVCEKTEW